MFKILIASVALASTTQACPSNTKEITFNHPRRSVCAAADTGSRAVRCQLKTLAKDGADLSFDVEIPYVSPTHAEAQVRGPNFSAQGHLEHFDGQQGSTDYLFGTIAPSADFARNGNFEADFHGYSDQTPRFHVSYKNGFATVYDRSQEIGSGSCESKFYEY